MSESDLVKELNINNHIAVKNLIENYQQYVYSICFNIIKKRQESEEATQDTFLKIIRNIKDYDISKSFKSWIFTISYRTAIDYYRRRKITVSQDTLIATPAAQFADDLLDTNEQNSQIEKLLSHLSEEDATLLRMYYLNEMSIKEMVLVTDMSESNLKIKLYRIRKELAKYVDLYFE